MLHPNLEFQLLKMSLLFHSVRKGVRVSVERGKKETFYGFSSQLFQGFSLEI